MHTLDLYEHLVRTGAWWDLVDEVATPWLLGIGSIGVLVGVAVVATVLAGRRARNGNPGLLLRAG